MRHNPFTGSIEVNEGVKCSQIEGPVLISAVDTGSYLSKQINYKRNISFVNCNPCRACKNPNG
jgi:hypothetical protein